MQEDLIEVLIGVEKDARKIKEEAREEIDELKEKYQERMDREERVRLDDASKKGKQLVEDKVNDAVKYSNRVKKEIKKELEEKEKKYNQVKDSLLDKYFQKITSTEGA